MSDVRIADLKARLSEHLRTVRNGGTLTVLDRDTPVARIVFTPHSRWRFARRSGSPRSEAPPKPARRTDSVALLLEDRRRR